MSNRGYRQADVVCPYYRADDGKVRLYCEAPYRGAKNTMFFRNKEAMSKHMDELCCKNYRRCRLGLAIDKKYEEE